MESKRSVGRATNNRNRSPSAKKLAVPYVVRVVGRVPPDISNRVSQVHATAIDSRETRGAADPAPAEHEKE